MGRASGKPAAIRMDSFTDVLGTRQGSDAGANLERFRREVTELRANVGFTDDGIEEALRALDSVRSMVMDPDVQALRQDVATVLVEDRRVDWLTSTSSPLQRSYVTLFGHASWQSPWTQMSFATTRLDSGQNRRLRTLHLNDLSLLSATDRSVALCGMPYENMQATKPPRRRSWKTPSLERASRCAKCEQVLQERWPANTHPVLSESKELPPGDAFTAVAQQDALQAADRSLQRDFLLSSTHAAVDEAMRRHVVDSLTDAIERDPLPVLYRSVDRSVRRNLASVFGARKNYGAYGGQPNQLQHIDWRPAVQLFVPDSPLPGDDRDDDVDAASARWSSFCDSTRGAVGDLYRRLHAAQTNASVSPGA